MAMVFAAIVIAVLNGNGKPVMKTAGYTPSASCRSWISNGCKKIAKRSVLVADDSAGLVLFGR